MGAWIQWTLCILISLLLALFLDVQAGVFLIAFLAFAGLLSGLSVLIFRRNIRLSLYSDNVLLEKGEEVNVAVKIERTDKGKLLRLIPAPLITVDIECGGGIYSEKPLSFTVMSGWQRSRIIEGKATAVYCGRSEIFIRSTVISGFLGLFCVKLPLKEDESKAFAAVFPEERVLSEGLAVMQRVCAGACFSDNEETSGDSFCGVGVLGYESREYQAGDSLKRINWKLSARKNGFWVRKDEYSKRELVAMVIDSKPSPEANKEDAAVDKGVLLEAVFSVGEYFLKNEIPVGLYYKEDEKWNVLKLSGTGDTEDLRAVIANVGFTGGSRFPEKVSDASSVLAFTLSPDGEAAGFLKRTAGETEFSDMIFAGGMKAAGWRAVTSDGGLSLTAGGLEA